MSRLDGITEALWGLSAALSSTNTNQPKPMEPITKRFGPTDPAFRHPQRICATVSWHVAQALQQRADAEGRSVSNLVAYELERSMLERHC